jgi:hypothetical protein
VDPCIYSSQHKRWLEAASTCTPTRRVCFMSKRRWAGAAILLERHTTLPILFRQHDVDEEHFTCRFAARLVEVNFRDAFRNDSERRAWLDDALSLQHDSWRRSDGPELGESKYRRLEVDKFLESQTWYVVQGTRPIPPVPLGRLRKRANNEPLARDYKYPYAICQLPTEDIAKLGI